MRYVLILFYLIVFFVLCEFFEENLAFVLRSFFVLNLILVLVFRYFNKEKEHCWKKEQSVKQYVFVIVFGLSFSFLNGIIYLDREWMMGGVEVYKGFSTVGFLNIVLFCPIVEELLYRKYWYAFLSKEGRYKILNIIFISLFFSLVHFYTSTPLIVPFIASLFLFWIYNLTNNILLCILCHISINGGGFLIHFLLPSDFEKITEVATVFVFLCSMLLFNKVLKKK